MVISVNKRKGVHQVQSDFNRLSIYRFVKKNVQDGIKENVVI